MHRITVEGRPPELGTRMRKTKNEKEFEERVKLLRPRFLELVQSHPKSLEEISMLPKQSGVYLVSDGDEHLYVGQSKNIRGRIRNHCSDSKAAHRSSFAFRMADKEFVQKSKENANNKLTREQRKANPDFHKLILQARARLRKMNFRYLVVENTLDRTLLEIYSAQALGTEHNSF